MTKISETPIIYNVTLTITDQEYSQAFPHGTKKFTIKERTGQTFRLAYETGRVATSTEPYVSINANQIVWEDHVYLVDKTVYLAAPGVGRVIEIICWV
jgi:hypothetical protein